MRRHLVLADLHVGSLVSIWPKNGVLPEGGKHKLNFPQRHLHRLWDRLLDELSEYDHFDSIIINGDVIDGGHARNAGVVTPRVDYQASAAIDLLTPIREMTDNFYMIRGTGFHGGEGDQNVTYVASALDSKINKRTNEQTWPELFLDVGDNNIWHFAHHVGTTSNIMYEATALLRELMNLRLNLENAYGRRAPNLTGICRAHRHRMIKICKNNWWALSVPAWKLKDDYAHKVVPSSLPEIGYAIIEWDTKVDVIAQPFPPPRIAIEGGS